MNTPLAPNSSQFHGLRNFENSAIEAMARSISEHLSSDEMMDIFDDGVGESYTLEERDGLSVDQVYARLMNTMLVRALLRVAEERALQAGGFTE